MFTSVKIEQFVYELAQLDDKTGETTEARMDIVAETSSLRAMLDIRCFVSTLASGWRSTRAHELEKHRRYVTHQDGRRCTNMQLSFTPNKLIITNRESTYNKKQIIP